MVLGAPDREKLHRETDGGEMEATAVRAERSEPGDSEQDEEEDVYEVERIIDMRMEEVSNAMLEGCCGSF